MAVSDEGNSPPTKKPVLSNAFIFQEVVMLKYIKKEKIRKLILPAVPNAIDQDTDNTVFHIFLILPKLHFTVC
jgi:hypothetical protein